VSRMPSQEPWRDVTLSRSTAVAARQLVQLLVGLFGFGASLALMVRAQLGLGPWDVLHEGVARRVGVEIGTVIIAVSVVVLLLWIPLHQRPGLGTLANAVLVGLSANATLAMVPTPDELAARIALLVAGIVGNGVATGLYIGAGLGPGPRDGLMTGLALRGYSVRAARTAIELAVLAIGWGLGGTVGVGTIAYAFGIGPLAHYFIPRLFIVRDQTHGVPSMYSTGSPLPTDSDAKNSRPGI
jgi:uncharacterized membrane protein YczE